MSSEPQHSASAADADAVAVLAAAQSDDALPTQLYPENLQADQGDNVMRDLAAQELPPAQRTISGPPGMIEALTGMSAEQANAEQLKKPPHFYVFSNLAADALDPKATLGALMDEHGDTSKDMLHLQLGLRTS